MSPFASMQAAALPQGQASLNALNFYPSTVNLLRPGRANKQGWVISTIVLFPFEAFIKSYWAFAMSSPKITHNAIFDVSGNKE